ncbi:MAG: alpha/beta fold hydrolase [Alphaproteobacteria bacterium]|nr:alpha/beta fold hydrolase [Alphaproteobacteria bacterium]
MITSMLEMKVKISMPINQYLKQAFTGFLSNIPCLSMVFAFIGFFLTAPAFADTPRLEPTKCWFDIPSRHTAKCWFLYVTENRTTNVKREIVLPVALLSTPDKKKYNDPVLYLEGGPGYSPNLIRDTIDDWWDWIESTPWSQERDLLLLDQRGTLSAKPSLNCPEFQNPAFKHLGENGFPYIEWHKLLIKTADQCLQRLHQTGAELSAYNSTESAADIADLLVLLDIKQVNIYSISYGTRLALTFIQNHPQLARAVILDSVYPPEVDAFVDAPAGIFSSFQRLFEDCAADEFCNQQYPNLKQEFLNLYHQLQNEPFRIPIDDADTRKPKVITITAQSLVLMFFEAFYDKRDITLLPRLIYELKNGRGELAASFIDDLLLSSQSSFSDGLYFSVECGEEYSSTNLTQQQIEAKRYSPYALPVTDYYDLMIICPFWPSTNYKAAVNTPIYSNIPALVLVGRYDPITPPYAAKLAAARLMNSYFFEFPDVGHGVASGNMCSESLIVEFINNPTVHPIHKCLGTLEKPDFR